MPLAPKLVIFDCDGVLVDSETISVGVLAEVVRKAGVEISGGEQACGCSWAAASGRSRRRCSTSSR